MVNPLKKLAGQTAIYGLPSILLRILGYLLTPLYTRVLDTQEYGSYVYLYSVVAFMIVVLTYGMETAFFRFYSKGEESGKVYATSLTSLIFTSTVFIGLVLFYTNSIARGIGYEERPDYIRYFGFILAFDALSAIPFAKLRALNKAKRFALLRMVNILINIALNLVFLLLIPAICSGDSHTGGWLNSLFPTENLVQYIFISNLIASAVTLLLLFPEMKISLSDFSARLLGSMLKYALPLLIAGFAGIINETFDRVLLKHLLPGNIAESQVGIYGACYKISILITLFIQAYRYAAEPFFFSQAGEKDAKLIYSQMLTYFVLIISIIFLVTMLYLDVIILFIGKDFREGRPVISVLMLANICLGIFYNLSIWYKLTNQTLYGALIAVAGAVITIVFNLWMIPDYGYMGSAWATLICYFAMMVISYRLGQKHFPIRYNLRKIAFYLGGALLIYFVSTLFYSQQIGVRLLVGTALLFIYLSGVFFLEYTNLKRIITSR